MGNSILRNETAIELLNCRPPVYGLRTMVWRKKKSARERRTAAAAARNDTVVDLWSVNG